MKNQLPIIERRNFLKLSGLAAGGFVLGFNLTGCQSSDDVKAMPSEWTDVNAFIKIGDTGIVTIYSPNPEIGQNVKTSMPMIVAEELDIDWKDVIVEQAPLDVVKYTRQVAGGSQSIRQGWKGLRTAGATARQMLVNAAATKWEVDASACTTSNGIVNGPNGNSMTYGELAPLAIEQEVPASSKVKLKDLSTFKIIGHDTRNVDLDNIITGKPLFGIDTKREGMRYAVVARPPSFGQTLDTVDSEKAKAVEGVEEVLVFGDKVAVIAVDTWSAMKGKEALDLFYTSKELLESTAYHDNKMNAILTDSKLREVKRSDGNVAKALKEADQVVERTYEAPFLPHNCLEPMNFFAHVTDEKIDLHGPIQTPKWTQSRVAKLLEVEEDEVHIGMTRMGGGFGRRLYGDFALEAAEISKLSGLPIQLIFSREDDMTAGTYRPGSKYTFKAGIKDNKLIAYQLVGAMVNSGNCVREHNFPASCLSHYEAGSGALQSNITTGAWRAPVTNFLAYAEQAFIDELAEQIGEDPVQFRLNLLDEAINNPVGELNYDPKKLKRVIELAAEKSDWKASDQSYKGISAYFSHDSYVAEVAEVELNGGSPAIKKITCAVDCGIVINPIAARNQIEGGIIDGIGHAMYGDFEFKDGRSTRSNFDTYRMIRMGEVPQIDTYFVDSKEDPTGLGEPTLPPAGGAIANALYKATKQRLYKQPFINEIALIG